MTERTCGACTACCFFPAVPSLGKPEFELCRHASERGCAIYADRPGECRDYECLWLSSELGELTDRPDRLGIVFDRPALVAQHPDYAGIDFICARELYEGARDGVRAADLLRRLSRAWVVRLTSVTGATQLIGPERLVRVLVARAAARGPA